MRIGIFGGSFNPPHLGHINSAETACRSLGLDKVLLIPAGIPPHKRIASGSPEAGMRLELLKAASEGREWAECSDIEIKRPGASYTIDTILELKSLMPDAQFVLLMGTDMIATFEQWKSFEEIISLVEIGAFARADKDEETIRKKLEELREKYGAKASVVKTQVLEISSTELRSLLCERKGREFFPDSEYSFIIKNRLYGAKPDYAWLREKAYAMLKPSRIPHVQGAERAAEELALRWGEDIDEAKTAAILHDITKKLSLQEQLLICEKYDIILNYLEKDSAKLLHPITGAAVSRGEFGVSDAVYSAIRWHTTGRPQMTKLEKVVYLADYIEPTRDFDGIDTIRKLAFENMDEAVLYGLGLTAESLREKNDEIHPVSLAAAEYYSRLCRNRSGA
ncbi:MAG: nicotinate (nicotinamide) nucleotide adenylyltransferase [Oscillospiraceae bacterium]|nr:nicotinate (nicotinamide) nucleotide adenylyltransferase [Oscillospiraceae bacterium]